MKIAFTNIPELLEIFPLDPWSRKHIIEILDNLNMEYGYASTSLGIPAIRLKDKDSFDKAKTTISNFDVE